MISLNLFLLQGTHYTVIAISHIFWWKLQMLYILPNVWVLRAPNAGKNLLFLCVLHSFARFWCKIKKNDPERHTFSTIKICVNKFTNTKSFEKPVKNTYQVYTFFNLIYNFFEYSLCPIRLYWAYFGRPTNEGPIK